ncbi:serine hydrolase-domain-containing protein [Aspergillus cavernicola]|uniref:Serine hydrolase-domain-containing protein n=1 Tax=Aspergillus cavernicola TaxID=176166 RepID=A0ABR4HP67_9EURO
MKILCLHGRGTSGAIFKSQTSSIRARLADLNLDFDFLDGQYPCTPAPGVDLFYPPPYYSYYEESPTNTTTPDSHHKTHTWLASIIAERGPYDLVLAFSQGTALAASMILLHELQAQETEFLDPDPESTGPFKSAIFICGGPSLPLLESIGYYISPHTKSRDLASRSVLSSMADSAAILSRGSSRWSSPGLDFDSPPTHPDPDHDQHPGPRVEEQLPSSFTFNKEAEIRREIAGPVQISIPTVHIYGEKDPRYIAGIQLSEVCVRGKRKVYNHGGGHEIPRFEAVSSAIADLVRWAVWAARAEL